MLDRETCEALRVLPEVWEHRWREGDAGYMPGEIRPGRWTKEMGTPYDGDWLWAPTLSDLLRMAVARCHAGPQDQPVLIGAPSGKQWSFGDGVLRVMQGECGSGDTPEAAVAAWLLARAKEDSPCAGD